MKKESLKIRILSYIRTYGGKVNGGEIERLALTNGYKASNASRRCRELDEEGLIKGDIINGTVWYSAIAKGVQTFQLSNGEVYRKTVY